MDCLPRDDRGAFFSESAAALKFTEALDQMHEELGAVLSQLTPDLAETLIREVQAAPRIFGCATGRSGFILRGFLMRLMHLGFNVYFVGETITPRIRPGRPAHRHVGLRRDGPTPGNAAPGQRRGGPHPGPDHPPGIHHRPGNPDGPGHPGHHQTDAPRRKPPPCNAPAASSNRPPSCSWKPWSSSSTRDAWATTRKKSWTAIRIWSRCFWGRGQGPTAPAPPPNPLPNPHKGLGGPGPTSHPRT